MLKNWISLVFDLNCNCNCSYCFQHYIAKSYDLSNDKEDLNRVVKYLERIYKKDHDIGVTFFGGEPLIHFDKIKKVLEMLNGLPINKRIISNGYLLTEEMIDVINENNIYFYLSNDGEDSSRIRGYNILNDKKKVALINKIKLKTLAVTLYEGNEDLSIVDRYMRRYLKEPIFSMLFAPMQVYKGTKTEKLVKNFDFQKYEDGLVKLRLLGHPFSLGASKHRIGFTLFSNGNMINLMTNTLVGKLDKDGKLVMVDGYERELREKTGCLLEKCEWYDRHPTYCPNKVYQVDDNDFCRKIAYHNDRAMKRVEKIKKDMGMKDTNDSV